MSKVNVRCLSCGGEFDVFKQKCLLTPGGFTCCDKKERSLESTVKAFLQRKAPISALRKALKESREGGVELGNTKFVLGVTVGTPGAIRAIEDAGQHPMEFLGRHARGDWGDICKKDKNENEFSLKNNLRLMSVYKTAMGAKVWVITEADRSATTLLLPEEY